MVAAGAGWKNKDEDEYLLPTQRAIDGMRMYDLVFYTLGMNVAECSKSPH